MNCHICNISLTPTRKKYCSKKCQAQGWRLENRTEQEVLGKYLKKFNDRAYKTDGCWIWKGLIGFGGYGKMHFYKKEEKAHRVAYTLFKGEIPNGLWVLHKCDNPPCVNPDHLFLGTRLDNIKDMVKKNRQNAPRGEKHSSAKLKIEQVIKIKQSLQKGINSTEIAKSLNINREHVYSIKYQRSWTHIQ